MKPVNAVLLQSRLVRPAARPNRVSRPRLVDSLNAGLTGKLTLISAPPGFGKTTLLAVTLLHGGQNGLAFLSDGLPNAASSWLVAGVYLTAALLVMLATRGRFGLCWRLRPWLNRLRGRRPPADFPVIAGRKVGEPG